LSSKLAARACSAVLFAAGLSLPGASLRADAKVFYARDEALRLAFPDADRTEARDFFLTPAQRSAIEERSRSALDTNLITLYVGHCGDQVVGYAVFDTHVVRTLPETFLVVLTSGGEVAATYVLAFYEPLDYLPSERWLRQFANRKLSDDLQVGQSIAGITGSTLSARAVTSGIRRALAIHAVLLGGK
jgi:S1-C subfamily serine protease